MQGVFGLSAGQLLFILVGQQPYQVTSQVPGGGTVLLVANIYYNKYPVAMVRKLAADAMLQLTVVKVWNGLP